WCESEVGKGSTFTFRLRLEKGNGKLVYDKQQPTITKTDRPMKILLAEDDPINQVVIKRMLEGSGHIVDIAENGAEALALYKGTKYNLLLMDIQMPVMDGIEAIKRIREMEAGRYHTPIVALTAYALKGDRERFMAIGADEYISKPVEMM